MTSLAAKVLSAEGSDRVDGLVAINHELSAPLRVIRGFSKLVMEQERDPIVKSYIQTATEMTQKLDDVLSEIATTTDIERMELHVSRVLGSMDRLIPPDDSEYCSDETRLYGNRIANQISRLGFVVRQILGLEPEGDFFWKDYLAIARNEIKLFGRNDVLVTYELPNTDFSTSMGYHVELDNLLGNAVKHGLTGEGKKRLHVDVSPHGQHYLVSVEDNGQGIDAKKVYAQAREMGLTGRLLRRKSKLNVIFQEGFTTRDEHQEDDHGLSNGIGLALVRQQIEDKGGQIWVKSEVGKGTTFYFTVPGRYVGER